MWYYIFIWTVPQEVIGLERNTVLKVVIAFLGVYLLFLTGVILVSTPNVIGGRITIGTLFFIMLGLGLSNRLKGKQAWEEVWCQVAARANLVCKTSGFWFGYPVHVTGIYQGHELTLYLNQRGRLQAPSTRIELNIKNHSKNYLRVRGPFPNDETDGNVIGNFFGAKGYQLKGMQFFAKSQPENLAANLFAPINPKQKPLLDQLLKLQRDVNIEIEGPKLYFDQIDILEDADYLLDLFNLLSNLADAFERMSQRVRP